MNAEVRPVSSRVAGAIGAADSGGFGAHWFSTGAPAFDVAVAALVIVIDTFPTPARKLWSPTLRAGPPRCTPDRGVNPPVGDEAVPSPPLPCPFVGRLPGPGTRGSRCTRASVTLRSVLTRRRHRLCGGCSKYG